MANYAELNAENVVTQVFVGKDEKDVTENWESYYARPGLTVKRTSYNTRGGIHYDLKTGKPSKDQSKALRKNYAGIGYIYDEDRDAFIPPKLYDLWVLNEDTCLWDAPIPYPEDGEEYTWDEEQGDWTQITNETE